MEQSVYVLAAAACRGHPGHCIMSSATVGPQWRHIAELLHQQHLQSIHCTLCHLVLHVIFHCTALIVLDSSLWAPCRKAQAKRQQESTDGAWQTWEHAEPSHEAAILRILCHNRVPGTAVHSCWPSNSWKELSASHFMLSKLESDWRTGVGASGIVDKSGTLQLAST